MILCKEEHAKEINSAVFPGQQGGPLMHVIAGKAVALGIAATEPFRERQQRTVDGAKVVAEQLLGAGHGVNVLTGGTDVHLVLVDLRESELDGQQAEDRLDDDRHHRQPQRGAVRSAAAGGVERAAARDARARDARARADDFREVGEIIATALTPEFEGRRDELEERVGAIAERFPLYAHLGTHALT